MSKFRRQLMMASFVEPVPPTPPLPYDAEVEYLESTGAQYIDTGVDLDDGTESIKLVFEASLNKANDGGNSLIIAASIPNSGVQVYTNSNNSIFNQGATKTFQLQRRYTFTTITTNTSRSIQINSDAAAVQTFSRRIDDGARLYLFATPNTASNGRGTAGKYFLFKVLRNDVLCLDLVPVRVGQVGYMYDRISGLLFGNAGTGNFILGNDIII